MGAYFGFVMLLGFSVVFLLLMGTGKLCGIPPEIPDAVIGAALGSCYCGVCLLQGSHWFDAEVVRVFVLICVGMLSFSLEIKPVAVFLLLCISLDGITGGMRNCGIWSLITGAACVLVLIIIGNDGNLMNIELRHRGKAMRLCALRDTGNGLVDPITGESVIVVGPEVAELFIGLNRTQLADPIGSVSLVPGLRLIPYHTVGNENALMLGMRFCAVRIGRRWKSRVVAFAPDGFSQNGKIQALTGR